MSSRRQRSIPLGGRYRQVSLYMTHCARSVLLLPWPEVPLCRVLTATALTRSPIVQGPYCYCPDQKSHCAGSLLLLPWPEVPLCRVLTPTALTRSPIVQGPYCYCPDQKSHPHLSRQYVGSYRDKLYRAVGLMQIFSRAHIKLLFHLLDQYFGIQCWNTKVISLTIFHHWKSWSRKLWLGLLELFLKMFQMNISI